MVSVTFDRLTERAMRTKCKGRAIRHVYIWKTVLRLFLLGTEFEQSSVDGAMKVS